MTYNCDEHYAEVAEWFGISVKELISRTVKGETLFNQHLFRNCKPGEVPF